MNEKFFSIDNEKKERILNAAIDEFASLGYDKASTNSIVKKAGISKGLLFHYFGSKKKLYVFIYNYGYELILERFNQHINFDETDILKLFKEIIIVKIELLKTYPNIFNFFISCYLENSKELKDEINVMGDSRKDEIYEKIFNGVDYTLFKDGIDVPKAINSIKWTFEQYGDEYVNKIKYMNKTLDPDEALEDINGYVDMFTMCYYK